MSSPPSLTALNAGFIIDQRYEVVRKLGQGANGVVYEVQDHRMGQRSALKFLLNFDPSAPWEEAAVLTGLEGEFVLPVRNAHHESGIPFIVTEIATHGTVKDKIKPGVGMPVDQAAQWTQQASRGTARVHDRQLLHLDIKPDNLFLDAHGNAILGDLGLASLRDTSGHGRFGGTPATMAPEVAQAAASTPEENWPSLRPTSARSDVYSLGATLHWMLTGRPPIEPTGADWPQIFHEVATVEPRDLLEVAPHVPRGVRDVVRTAMDRDPAMRYPTPSALDAALGRRARPLRNWTRLVPHPGHHQCFTGTGGSKRDLAVCVVPTGARTQHSIRAFYLQSGQRACAESVVSLSQVPAALRSLFRRLQ
ncbi:serine/threonine-protein kinase [Pedococcus bigeumensis]|nr:serine/threonine-protein kinase [Pedococcus bigeumensis]